MSIFAARALWPNRDKAPFSRIAIALLAAPGLLSVLLALTAFLVMGMTEASGDAVLRQTLQAAAALGILVYGFTLTFGVAGIALLWALGRRGVLAWAITGGGAGAISGLLFGAFGMPGISVALIIAFAIGGWAVFLLFRRLAAVGAAEAAA